MMHCDHSFARSPQSRSGRSRSPFQPTIWPQETDGSLGRSPVRSSRNARHGTGV